MTKDDRDEAFNDYARRGVRELADMLVQADEHIEELTEEVLRLRALVRHRSGSPARGTR